MEGLVWVCVLTVLGISTRPQMRRGHVSNATTRWATLRVLRAYARDINDKLTLATEAGEVAVVGETMKILAENLAKRYDKNIGKYIWSCLLLNHDRSSLEMLHSCLSRIPAMPRSGCMRTF